MNANDVAAAGAGSVSFLKMSVALVFVLALIFLTAWLFRRLNGIRTPRRGLHRASLQVTASLPLGERRFLSVVEVEGRRFLIGVAAQSISRLAELDTVPIAAGEAAEPGAVEFAGLLEKARRAFRRVRK